MLPYAAAQQTEENDIQKLTVVVTEAIERIASSSGLSEEKVLKILEAYSVAEIREGKINGEAAFKASAFNKALDKAVKSISYATGLNSVEISSVFNEIRGSSLDNVVRRLREKSKQNRWILSHY